VRQRKKKEFLRPGELFFAILIAAFSVVALWQAYQISGFTGLSTPGIFPMLAATTMLISALFILYDAVSRRQIKTSSVEKVQVFTGRLALIVSLVAAYVFAMPYFGFMISSAFFLFLSFAYLWRKSVLISALLTAATLLAIYLIFRVLFQVVLPRGSLVQGWF